MVCKGQFTAELVQAKTKQKFLEHEKHGKVYVEVEPDVEYFIHIQNNSSTPVAFEAFVDDQDLGYSFHLEPKNSGYMGLWSVNEKCSKMTALELKKLKKGSRFNISNLESLLGDLKVFVYQSIEDTYTRSQKEIKSHWKDPNNTKLVGNFAFGKKFVKSKRGDYCKETTLKNDYKECFKIGNLIEKIYFKYCTVDGLKALNILPALPEKLPEKRTNQNQLTQQAKKGRYKLNIEPTILLKQVQTNEGAIYNKKEIEEFNLTYATDGDSCSNVSYNEYNDENDYSSKDQDDDADIYKDDESYHDSDFS